MKQLIIDNKSMQKNVYNKVFELNISRNNKIYKD